MESAIGAIDYVVFGLVLAVSVAIGFFYAFKDRRNDSMENFHRGNKKANPVSVSLSLSVTIINALSIIGVPGEVYTHGIMVVWQAGGMLLATIFSAHFFLPVFFKMDKISVFEYLQMRYGRLPRILGSIAFLINTFLLISFALYAPSLAFQAMTGVSLWIVMAVAAFVCMTYTLLGGMKAVLWADTLQCFVMLAGILCMLIAGSNEVGGFTRAWKYADEHGRIELFNVSVDPRTRHTIWTLTIGFFFGWSNGIGINQAAVQRACSLPKLKTAQIAEWASFPALGLVIILSACNGVVMFAYYRTCDPVQSGRVSTPDQLFPLMILDILGRHPGLPGLLLAGMFSGALSTISSGLSAISAVIVEDFVIPYSRKPLSDRKQLIISKILVIITSVIEYALAGGISRLGGLIVQMINTVTSLFGGPLLALFLFGMLYPWLNVAGVCAGIAASLGLTGWLIFGAMATLPPLEFLPVSTAGCLSTLNNVTELPSTTTTESSVSNAHEYSGLEEFYKLSYMWYNAFSLLVFTVVSFTVTFITGPNDPKQMDSSLIVPLFYRLCPFLPEKYRRKLLFGVNFDEKGDTKVSYKNGHTNDTEITTTKKHEIVTSRI